MSSRYNLYLLWLREKRPSLFNGKPDTYSQPDYNAFAHHGVKGQKWGVRKGPPYPLDKSAKRSTIVDEAVESGQVSKTINRDKQRRHTKSEHIPGRSYLDGDEDFAQELVDKYSGKGVAIIDKHNKWTNKEKFDHTSIIGTHIDTDGIETRTNKGVITYSKTGAHVYPRKEN